MNFSVQSGLKGLRYDHTKIKTTLAYPYYPIVSANRLNVQNRYRGLEDEHAFRYDRFQHIEHREMLMGQGARQGKIQYHRSYEKVGHYCSGTRRLLTPEKENQEQRSANKTRNGQIVDERPTSGRTKGGGHGLYLITIGHVACGPRAAHATYTIRPDSRPDSDIWLVSRAATFLPIRLLAKARLAPCLRVPLYLTPNLAPNPCPSKQHMATHLQQPNRQNKPILKHPQSLPHPAVRNDPLPWSPSSMT